jgi:hypothetical protein
MSFGIPVRNGLSIGLLASTFLSSGGRLVPRLTLNFLTGAPLDSRITFTRSTTATFVGSDGLIQSAAINAPRFDFNPATLAPLGLLMEEQRVNLALYSEQFDNVAWVKLRASITANATTSPDGTASADKLIDDGVSIGVGFINQTITYTNVTHTFSFYAKAGEVTSVTCYIVDTVGVVAASNATINLTNGLVTSGSAIVTDAGNGWYRIAVSGLPSAGLGGARILLPADTATTNGFFIWGAQVEASAFATSYIPTVASTVTRAADVAVMTGTNFSSWYNASEGTIVSETAIYSTVARNGAAYDINDTTGNNRTIYRTITTVSNDQAVIRSGGVLSASLSTVAAVNTSPRKAALTYKANDFALSANGSAVVSSSSGAVPVSVTQMQLGSGVGPSEWINGHLRRITYYPTRLTNAQLQALTA